MLRRLLLGSVAFLPAVAFAAEPEKKKGMPQLDPSTFPSQLFWLAVFFALFYGFMSLVAMPRLQRILDARQARISDDLNHATTASETAQMLKAELDAALGHSREQSRGLIAAANDESRRKAAERDATLSVELTAKIEQAEASVKEATAKAMNSIADIASGIALQILPVVAPVSANDAEVRGAVDRAGSRNTTGN